MVCHRLQPQLLHVRACASLGLVRARVRGRLSASSSPLARASALQAVQVPASGLGVVRQHRQCSGCPLTGLLALLVRTGCCPEICLWPGLAPFDQQLRRVSLHGQLPSLPQTPSAGHVLWYRQELCC